MNREAQGYELTEQDIALGAVLMGIGKPLTMSEAREFGDVWNLWAHVKNTLSRDDFTRIPKSIDGINNALYRRREELERYDKVLSDEEAHAISLKAFNQYLAQLSDFVGLNPTELELSFRLGKYMEHYGRRLDPESVAKVGHSLHRNYPDSAISNPMNSLRVRVREDGKDYSYINPISVTDRQQQVLSHRIRAITHNLSFELINPEGISLWQQLVHSPYLPNDVASLIQNAWMTPFKNEKIIAGVKENQSIARVIAREVLKENQGQDTFSPQLDKGEVAYRAEVLRQFTQHESGLLLTMVLNGARTSVFDRLSENPKIREVKARHVFMDLYHSRALAFHFVDQESSPEDDPVVMPGENFLHNY